MYLWKNPKWFNSSRRTELLDDNVSASGETRFGLKEVSESDKAGEVKRHFDSIAHKYDFMNSLLSFGIQYLWKRKAVGLLDINEGCSVIDVCGGTGDLAVIASNYTRDKGNIIIYDINNSMMKASARKIEKCPYKKTISRTQGDAEKISFPDESFDVAMVGFGIRNLTHLKKGFREMHRVLKPGGKFLCLEFSRPSNPAFRLLYDFYSFSIMPALGKLFTGMATPYACLPETIRMFPLPDELSDILGEIGFEVTRIKKMTNGIAVAHVAIKR